MTMYYTAPQSDRRSALGPWREVARFYGTTTNAWIIYGSSGRVAADVLDQDGRSTICSFSRPGDGAEEWVRARLKEELERLGYVQYSPQRLSAWTDVLSDEGLIVAHTRVSAQHEEVLPVRMTVSRIGEATGWMAIGGREVFSVRRARYTDGHVLDELVRLVKNDLDAEAERLGFEWE